MGGGTLLYVDPPYPHGTRSQKANRNGGAGRAHAYRHEMTDDDHRELAAVLRSCKGMVIVSGYDCQLYKELFGDWQKVTKAVFADGARPRTECLWLSPSVVAARAPLFQSLPHGETA